MDISKKHLEMIQFALGRYIDEMISKTVPEEHMAVHVQGIAEYIELHDMIGTLILKQ